MRYAEGPTVEVSLVMRARPADVWPVVTDVDLPARFSSEYQGGHWLEGSPASVGARFAGRNFHAAMGQWETVCTVTESEPDRVFAYAVGDPAEPGATWRYTLVPAPDDVSTRVDYWMRMGPGWSGLCVAIEAMPDKEERIVARRCEEHRANMLRTLEGIRGVVEGSDGSEGAS